MSNKDRISLPYSCALDVSVIVPSKNLEYFAGWGGGGETDPPNFPLGHFLFW